MHAVLHGVEPRPAHGAAQGQPRQGRLRPRRRRGRPGAGRQGGAVRTRSGWPSTSAATSRSEADVAGRAAARHRPRHRQQQGRADHGRRHRRRDGDPAAATLAVDAPTRAGPRSTPRRVWWGDVVALAAELLGQGGPTPIAAVCVSGVGPCLVLCDEQDRPVRPAILYGIDMRATAEIDELTERYGADEVLRPRGTPLTTQAVGPKALWVRRHEPEVWARAARWYNSNSYVVAQAHRRVRPGPPHGQPVRPALRPRRPATGAHDLVRRGHGRPARAAAGVAGRGRRRRCTAAAAEATGLPGRDARVRRHRRRLGRGVQRRGAPPGRPDADVRLDDVLRRRCCESSGRAPAAVDHRRRRARARTRLAAGMATSGSAHLLGAGARRRRAVRRCSSPRPRDAAGRRRPARAALLRRRADADLRPAGPRRHRRPDAAAHPRRTSSAPSTRASLSASARSSSSSTPTTTRSSDWSPSAAAPRAGCGRRSSATSPGASSRCPSRRSAPATATR